ncbi:hypothetical protein F5Y13DRAFT_29321 [Hypoxylon sp. FL1857]|nr:hypothetical protein F5Y13DRAFT_29321 [Hypoxylon sp. FL1857]
MRWMHCIRPLSLLFGPLLKQSTRSCRLRRGPRPDAARSAQDVSRDFGRCGWQDGHPGPVSLVLGILKSWLGTADVFLVSHSFSSLFPSLFYYIPNSSRRSLAERVPSRAFSIRYHQELSRKGVRFVNASTLGRRILLQRFLHEAQILLPGDARINQ